jgi:quercetin dioxygenase-like cupin family protein
MQLPTERHRVYRLAPDLLLVFKPRGHREVAHSHSYAQRLRVLRGKLQVRRGRRTSVMQAGGRPITIASGSGHETVAVTATWLIVELLLRRA